MNRSISRAFSLIVILALLNDPLTRGSCATDVWIGLIVGIGIWNSAGRVVYESVGTMVRGWTRGFVATARIFFKDC